MVRTRLVLGMATVFVLTALCSAYGQPEAYGLPARLKNLTDLQLVNQRKDLSAAQRTDVLVAWLLEERKHPSAPSRGLGGGEIDSAYIQAQLIKALGGLGDPAILREMVSDAQLDPVMRDSASLALGHNYDIAQVQRLLIILEKSAEPRFRALAASSLGKMGVVEAQPALERALQDEFSVQLPGRAAGSVRTIYPVREAAKIALRVLNTSDPELLKSRKERIEAFAQRLQAAQATRKMIGK